MHLVLIETVGNQAFVFATNKLRENVGASELTAQAGTRFVLEAVRDVGAPDLCANSAAEMRKTLRDSSLNRPADGSNPVEVILAVSGKALLLVNHEESGRRIVSQVTRRALKEAPGLEVRGVVSVLIQTEKYGTLDLHRENRVLHVDCRPQQSSPTFTDRGKRRPHWALPVPRGERIR